jgi:nifR3 family TIM-barrel protein
MLTIGELKIPHPFAQAALSGYSDLPMRRVARRHGAAYAVGQVVLGRNVTHASDWQRRVLQVPADDHPVGAQLMGADPREFGPAARALADAGYDVIDINFGCPVHKVVRRCRGGWLLADPPVALEIVERVLDALGGDRPVTVKMRRGLDDSGQSERRFFTILDGVFARGAAAVTVHARTVQQRYAGRSAWGFLRRVKRHVGDRVVLGSGDLFRAADAVAMLRITGVDGVSLARGAIGNPWIFRDCLALQAGRPLPPPPSMAELRETLWSHFREAAAFYGPRDGGMIMRRHAMRYSRFHTMPRKVREAFNAMKQADAFATLLDAWFPPDEAQGASGRGPVAPTRTRVEGAAG